MKTYGHTHTHTHTHTYIHTYTHIYTHTYIHTYTRTHIYTYTHTIETYGPAPRLQPTNRNIWPSPTPTANQYKHMAQRRILETYGHTIAGRRRRRHAWPILLSASAPAVYPLLLQLLTVVLYCIRED